MVVKVHGGIIDDQTLAGSLRYFDITDAGGLGTNVIADGNQRAISASVAAGGTTYALADILTATAPTGTDPTFTVTAVNGTVVTAVSLLTGGDVSAINSQPSATTASPANGSGCTLNVNYTSTIIIPGAGVGPSANEQFYVSPNKPIPGSAADLALTEVSLFANIVQIGIVSATVIRIACENTGFGWDRPGGGDAAADMQTAIVALSVVTVPDTTTDGVSFDFASATVVERTFASFAA